MRKDPALTYRGALTILGHYDRPWLVRLDRLLGGVIVAAPVASLGPSGVLLSAVWAWVDPKNEVMALLRAGLDQVGQRLLTASGYGRHQLVSATHTALVAAAFLDALREELGPQRYKRLRLTDTEQRHLSLDVAEPQARLVDLLYRSSVPAPSPARGFDDNVKAVTLWYRDAAGRLERFFDGLDQSVVSVEGKAFYRSLVDTATDRYRGWYLSTAADVPEFFVWGLLHEHAAARRLLTDTRHDLLTILDGHGIALRRLEQILIAVSTPGEDADGQSDLCRTLRRANQGALREPIVPSDYWRSAGDLVRFPELDNSYVEPGYRICEYEDGSWLSDELRWQQRPVKQALDLTLASFATSPESVTTPLLVLGHPGSGKSLLTKVLAARLPATRFTVVRVPLRRVAATAPVYEQIQATLDGLTNGRIAWPELVEQSRDRIRVVLLDGLDELLQASTTERAGYLQEVADFQRRESEQERPVVVVVTSRTVVADMVTVPRGTPVIRLEDFDTKRITRWLDNWNEANAAAVCSGALRPVDPEEVLRHPTLASQPLLLLMLTLYSADPGSVPLEATLSTTQLYSRLLENFARREVERFTAAHREDLDALVRGQLWRLAVAAFGMFNRGRREVSDIELGEDLKALGLAAAPSRSADLGQRTFGQFFFVHAAESDGHRDDRTRFSYEFLHGTFGEYLIASHLVDELDALAVVAGRPGRYEVSDDLLHALLSHQVLAAVPNILQLAAELLGQRPATAQSAVLDLLDRLLAGCRNRHSSTRFSEYQPLPVDQLRAMAAFSANLVMLRAVLDRQPVQLARIWPGRDASELWRSTVDMWRAGLDVDSWHAMLAGLQREGDTVQSTRSPDRGTAAPPDLAYAELIGSVDRDASYRSMVDLINSGVRIGTGRAPLIIRLAENEIDRTAALLRDLGQDRDATYEGEDRDWLLALTRQAQTSIDSTSLTTVDAGGSALTDGGLWHSDLGARYLDEQRQAIARGVTIRRVFIIDRPELVPDPAFLALLRLQRDIGISVRVLDPTRITSLRRGSLFDFIVFDGVVSYEVRLASRMVEQAAPVRMSTVLVTAQNRVLDRISRYEDLWSAAPEPDLGRQ